MFLLDTDMVIYSLNGDPAVVAQLERHLEATKSSQAVHNLAKVRQLREILPIYSITTPIMETFGNLKADLEGQRIDDFDLSIAATALNLSLILVTNNERHFSRIKGLAIQNWTQIDQ